MDNYKVTFETWNNVAEMYRDKFMDLDLYNDTYDNFCERIKKQNAKILEIGCGPGNITKYILSKRPDLKITAIDIAPNMLKLAKEINPTAEFKLMDCRNVDTIEEKFDAVMCGFCLPYLSKADCAKLIKDCSELLSAGGTFYFSAIEDNYSKSNFETSSDGKHKMFIYYHEANYLQEMLEQNSFEKVNLQRKQYSKPNGTNSTHIIFITTKK